jgi:predicted O-methyltransferase YrrM
MHQLISSRSIVASLVAASWLLPPLAAAQEVLNRPHLDVIYVPTPNNVVQRMLEMAQVRSDDYVIDLGSGDGRVLVAAAKTHGARGFGVDIDPERVKEARQNAQTAGVADRVEFRQQNLFETPIREATVLTMYLMPDINLKLRPRVLSELRPGTRVVSHDFDMKDWKPDQRTSVGRSKVYMWIVPAKVEGRWTVQTDDGQSFALDLKQRYQEIEGTATLDGRALPIRQGRVRGAQISFAIATGQGRAVHYTGQIVGNMIQATRVRSPRSN